MQESRDNGGSESPADKTPVDDNSVPAAVDATEADGWQQYRRWISKAPAPMRGRSGVDPSLYTWKGYRDWAKQVKRNWSSES
ncbi:MAG TPA: hypothetical protein VFU80_07790 [Sphingomicrobium sp.]|nr:hypothetical protein [Sphingomicrobium sp.]